MKLPTGKIVYAAILARSNEINGIKTMPKDYVELSLDRTQFKKLVVFLRDALNDHASAQQYRLAVANDGSVRVFPCPDDIRTNLYESNS